MKTNIVFVIIMMCFMWLCGLFIGLGTMEHYYRNQAVENNVAHYEVDNTGHVTFVWGVK
jgi:hypothetical protein